MKIHIIISLTLLLISQQLSASEDKEHNEESTPREEKVEENGKEKNQSPYYEAEFTQDSYYRVSRSPASFETEASK